VASKAVGAYTFVVVVEGAIVVDVLVVDVEVGSDRSVPDPDEQPASANANEASSATTLGRRRECPVMAGRA